MGTKNNPGQFDCYDDIDPDEPFFVLRAKDPLAAMIVRWWAGVADKTGVSEEKVREALSCSYNMWEWRMKNAPDKEEHPDIEIEP